MTKTFTHALIEAVDSGPLTLRAVADGAGVSYEQLKKLKQGQVQTTNVEDAMKIARFFGKSLEEFIEDPSLKDRIEIASLWSRLSPQQRDVLRGFGEGLLASGDQALQKDASKK